ncbi:MAG: glycoside hydrolase family 2 protein [Pirellulaceae bacterium]
MKRPAIRILQACLAALTCGVCVAVEPSFPRVDAQPLGTVPSDALVLHANWQMRESVLVGTDAAAISQPGYDAADWYATTIPTTALGTLVHHGRYPDPYVGTNNMRIPDASDAHNARYGLTQWSHLPDKANPWAKPYWFRTEFRAPASLDGRAAWLHLDGLNYRADVWLNGHQIGEANAVAGMFRRFRFEVSSLLNPHAPNALAVLVHPLDHPGDPIHEQLDGLTGSFGPNGGDGEILRNVTEYCAIGWDWVPAARDRNIGLWQHVWLETTGPVAVRDPAAFTELTMPTGEEAAVTVRCHLDNADPVVHEVELVVRLAPDGFAGESAEVRTHLTLAANARNEVTLTPDSYPALVLHQPQLWWPVNYGAQPLYRLTVEARVDGAMSQHIESRFGVRSVGSVVLPSGGRAFTVNGRVIRLTGGAWIPDFLMSWSAQRYRDEVRLMAEGNHTVVRVNGCGIVPPDTFFDECDRRGLLVWQDLSRTSVSGTHRKDGLKTWNPPAADTALYLANMQDCIVRLRGRPCLLLWCGSNEAVPQADAGQALQNEILPALDGTRPWLPSSSEMPTWRKEDGHIWTGGPWHLVRLPEYFHLYAVDPQFTARNEIGLPSVLSVNSVARAMPDWDKPHPAWFPLNRELGYHDASESHFRTLDSIARQDVGDPACLAEYLWLGDLYSNVSYRAIFEAANKVRPRNAGTHLWKVNAAWPGMMWQVFDWYLRPNAGYYSLRSACRPLHVQFAVDDQSIQVVSTLAVPRPQLRVRVALYDAAGRHETSGEFTLDAAADATTPVGQLPPLADDGRFHFVALDLLDADAGLLDRVVTWFRKDCRWPELLTLPPATVEARALHWGRQADETVCRVAVRNTGAVPAVQVFVGMLRGHLGNEVLPSFWSDNALTLMPDEAREVEVRFRSALLDNEVPHLIVEGWNVTPRETIVADNRPVPLALHVTASEVRVEAGVLQVCLDATQMSALGPRWTTWPVPVQVDDQPARWVRVAVRPGATSRATVRFDRLPPGPHRVCVGQEPAQTVNEAR